MAFFYFSVIAENRTFRLQLVCTANPGKKEDFPARNETAQNEGGCFPHTFRFQAPKPRALTRPPQRSVSLRVLSRSATPTAISKPRPLPSASLQRDQKGAETRRILLHGLLSLPPLSCCVPLVSPSCKGTRLGLTMNPYIVSSPGETATKTSHRVT